MTQELNQQSSDTNMTDKLIEALISMLHSSLSQALNKLAKNFPDKQIVEILPITLANFVYRELFILSTLQPITIDKLEALFNALLRDRVENDIIVRHALDTQGK